MRDVYIVSYARTPIGAFQGTLSSVNACELGGIAIKGTFIITKSISQKLAAVERAGLHELTAIDDVLMGNVISAGLGQAPGSTAARLGGLPNCIPASTVNKVCASGMKAIMLAASSIRCGAADIIIAGGMESMSQAPHLLNIRKGAKYGDQSVIDSLRFDGLTDAATNVAMGLCGEKCASDYGITREASDEYAKKTYERAIEFASKVAKEIVPVSIPAGKGKFNMIDADETPKNYNPEKMVTLKSTFKEGGTVTAANASPLNDGAAALLICSGEAVEKYKLPVLAKIIGWADAAQEGIDFTTTPSLAIPKALKHAGRTMQEVDAFEINEAFSSVALANIKILDLDPSKVNKWGGAVAVGHPLGCSGARITGTLTSILQHYNAKLGVAAICNGGGGASAIVIERQS